MSLLLWENHNIICPESNDDDLIRLIEVRDLRTNKSYSSILRSSRRQIRQNKYKQLRIRQTNDMGRE